MISSSISKPFGSYSITKPSRLVFQGISELIGLVTPGLNSLVQLPTLELF